MEIMKEVLRNIVARTYKPLLVKYLSKTRIFTHEGLKLEIPPEVFHPGFFFSTSFLLQFIKKLSLKGKSLLELGAGSGLISFVAARKGSIVTASDINPVAVQYLRSNAIRNGIQIRILDSDLFNEIPPGTFDLIAINPPYYRKNAVTHRDHAWFCGENGEYFHRLFESLPAFMNPETEALMVLFEGCDMEMIHGAAAGHGFNIRCIKRKKNILETNFIYKIERKN